MNERLEGVLQIVLAIVIVAIVLLFSDNVSALKEYGYLGIFVISLLSAATLFFPAPGWATVIAMSGVLNPYLVGITAGIGSGLGEITGFIAGDGARHLARKRIREYRRFEEAIRRYDVAAVFVLSFIPNPAFDIAGLAAGALKIPYWRFIIPCILGRTLRYVILAYMGAFTLGLLQ